MFSRMILIFFLGIVLIGCGADETPEPGEEVVTEKWVDPKDIGKEYSIKIEDLKFDVTYTLDTGKTVTFKEGRRGDGVQMTEDGSIGAFITVPVLDDNGDPVLIDGNPVVRDEYIGNIVPDGDPIVSLVSWFGWDIQHVTKDRSVIDYLDFYAGIRIDRVLDYNLPIYLEYRTQDRPELGNEVRVIRFLAVVPKGKMIATMGDSTGLYAGDLEKHEKAYVSVLPHTEMKKIDLPAAVGFPGKTEELRVELRGIPEGHKFRPYRIRSSSFLMGNTESSADW